MNGLPGQNLPEITFPEQLVVATLTQAAMLPVMVALIVLFRAAGSAEFRWRFPALWAEVRRRRAAEARFAAMSGTARKRGGILHRTPRDSAAGNLPPRSPAQSPLR